MAEFPTQRISRQRNKVTEVDNLKAKQINFLLAIAKGEKNFSSAAVLKKTYNLGTSANIKNLKKAIIDKGLVNIESGTMTFLNPIFKHWLLQHYR